MNEPDYCERCDLYTMQKQEPEPEDTCETWYCPVCDTFEERTDTIFTAKHEMSDSYIDEQKREAMAAFDKLAEEKGFRENGE